ncbi:unnamed protein product, partial [marine sediment metagenome]
VNEAFDRTGAKFNAFTGEESTVYYAAVLPEYLLEITRLWTRLLRPALRKDDFGLEKNVIKEEIAMYKDLPHYDVMDRARALHFKNHPCGHSVLGTEESITNLSAEQMQSYFSKRYAPNNIIAACAGNFDFDSLCQTIQADCSDWQKAPADRNLQPCPGSAEKQRLEKPGLVREHICLVSAAVSAQDPRRYAAQLLTTIVGDSVGSRFFWALVDTALAETATMQFEPMDHIGALYSYIRCSPENFSKVMATVINILRDLTS